MSLSRGEQSRKGNDSFAEAELPHWPQYGEEANTMVFNGYGSSIQQDNNDRSAGIQFIIDNVLTDGAL